MVFILYELNIVSSNSFAISCNNPVRFWYVQGAPVAPQQHLIDSIYYYIKKETKTALNAIDGHTITQQLQLILWLKKLNEIKILLSFCRMLSCYSFMLNVFVSFPIIISLNGAWLFGYVLCWFLCCCYFARILVYFEFLLPFFSFPYVKRYIKIKLLLLLLLLLCGKMTEWLLWFQSCRSANLFKTSAREMNQDSL